MEEPSVKGFTVRTASGSIRDLGTVFGVRVDKAGAVDAAVFDGNVEWIRPGSGWFGADSVVAVAEGEALRVGAGPDAVAKVSIAAPDLLGSFCISMAEAACRPLSLSGVRYLSGHGGNCTGLLPKEALVPDAVLVLETTDTELPKPLRISLVKPGTYDDYGGSFPLRKGSRVTSYLIKWRPGMEAGCTGSVTFSRPILGIMASDKLLVKSDSAFPYTHDADSPGFGLESRSSNKKGPPDFITLSDDMRTRLTSTAALRSVTPWGRTRQARLPPMP